MWLNFISQPKDEYLFVNQADYIKKIVNSIYVNYEILQVVQ